jgi:hypothetical protein
MLLLVGRHNYGQTSKHDIVGLKWSCVPLGHHHFFSMNKKHEICTLELSSENTLPAAGGHHQCEWRARDWRPHCQGHGEGWQGGRHHSGGEWWQWLRIAPVDVLIAKPMNLLSCKQSIITVVV